MLKLTEDLFINAGGMRRCYRYPTDKTRCVKVYRPLKSVPKTHHMKLWRIWWGQRCLCFNMNHYEYHFWQELTKNIM